MEEEEEKKPPRYHCRICMNPVAFVGDEIKIGEIPSLSAQVNPHGFVHEVLTMRYVQNSILHGEPCPADSWFPGFLWLYCSCKVCISHLGWAYYLPNQSQYTFVGLRKASVVVDEGS